MYILVEREINEGDSRGWSLLTPRAELKKILTLDNYQLIMQGNLVTLYNLVKYFTTKSNSSYLFLSSTIHHLIIF